MKALRFVAENSAEVQNIDVPQIAADEVLIAARSVGVCHSDIELLEGRYIIPFEYPVIPGHEWSGEVAKVGADVTEFVVGDRVVGECVIGEDHFGFSISGAAAEFFVVKAISSDACFAIGRSKAGAACGCGERRAFIISNSARCDGVRP